MSHRILRLEKIKWQLNGIYNQLPGSSERDRPVDLGFDEYSLWQLTTGRGRAEGGGERFWSPPIETNGRFVSIEENAGLYGPDLFCEFLCDFMERHRDRPFFVYYPMVLVHDPFVPTPRSIGDRPRDHSANREPRDPAEKKANFVAMVEYMDEIIGRLVDQVDALGLAENTLVLFTADNGTHPKILIWRALIMASKTLRITSPSKRTRSGRLSGEVGWRAGLKNCEAPTCLPWTNSSKARPNRGI